MYRRAMCSQVVTLYHPVPEKKHVVRTVLRGSFCQLGKRSVPDASGDKAGAAMLLVLPDVTQGVRVDGANAAAGQGLTEKTAGEAVDLGSGLTAGVAGEPGGGLTEHAVAKVNDSLTAKAAVDAVEASGNLTAGAIGEPGGGLTEHAVAKVNESLMAKAAVDAVEASGNLTVRTAGWAKSAAQSGAAGSGLRALRYGVDYRVTAGDRVVVGEGPAVTWDDWPRFVPAEVDGMGVITYVLPLYLHGELHHVEAGAWWSAGGAGAGRLAR